MSLSKPSGHNPVRELSAEVALQADDYLGEGPTWDGERQELSWVDITRAAIRSWQPESGRVRDLALDPPISFAVPRVGGGFVVGREHEIAVLDDRGSMETVFRVGNPAADTRFNDGKCDAAGRLWAGTMSTVREPGVGTLYRVAGDGAAAEVVAETTVSNGLAWSPDNRRFYFTDSTTQRVDVFDFELKQGTIANRRPWIEIDPRDGLPDGLTVDNDGGLWVSLFGGGEVRRYDATAQLEARAKLPVSNPTSVTFGGAALDRLFVTTAKHRLSDEQRAGQPLAGAIFALEAGVTGLPHSRFSG
jgi:sugar lactone lactonase YvrE